MQENQPSQRHLAAQWLGNAATGPDGVGLHAVEVLAGAILLSLAVEILLEAPLVLVAA